MLISTSRKPSQKTRKFCKNLAHATGSTSVNRGKSNMRELLLKALELEEHNLAIVNEIKGNPSRVTFYSNKGEVLLIILIGVNTSNERCHILPKNLKIVSKVEELNVLSEILGFELV
ncbi:ribonucleotide-diphosphate reductase subunit beta, partial [Methanobrevibacter smithii]|uniref:ribonucleotide-diphosphate reductase subunit beta n=2 Tax=Methanobacteriaceae TaxID=2159 RepID=UPI00384FD3EC